MRVQFELEWKYVGMIVCMGLLIAVAVAPLSRGFGQGKGGSGQDMTAAMSEVQTAQQQHTQSINDASAQLNKAKAQAQTPFEKEMVSFGDKILAAAKAGATTNQKTLAAMKVLQQTTGGSGKK